MVTKQQIEEVKNNIVDAVQPKAVYLIRSYATNDTSEKSNLDFLIISKNSNIHKYERTASIQKKLFRFPQMRQR